MPAKTKAPTSPSDAERRAFGDLADDIAFLRRGCWLEVAPFRGAFRVGTGAAIEVVTAAGISARAQQERNRRQARPGRR